MRLRWTVILSGLAAAAVGGAASMVPAMLSSPEAGIASDFAPSRQLETSRRAVLTSTEGVIVDLGSRTEHLNVLSELLADAAGEDSARPLRAGGVSVAPSDRHGRVDTGR